MATTFAGLEPEMLLRLVPASHDVAPFAFFAVVSFISSCDHDRKPILDVAGVKPLPNAFRSFWRSCDRARNKRVFVAGTVRPSASAVSRIERPDTLQRVNTSLSAFGSLETASATALSISARSARFSGVRESTAMFGGVPSRPRGSKLSLIRCRRGSRRRIRHWFRTIRVIQVLKLASPRNDWKFRNAER